MGLPTAWQEDWDTATMVITKLSSFLLVCIGVQIAERHQGIAGIGDSAPGLTGRLLGRLS